MERRKPFAVTLVLAVLITIFTVRFAFFGTYIPNASAVTVAQNLGAYWDKNCNKPVYSVDWGTLSPAEHKEVVVWVQNEGNETLILALTTLNWNPNNASLHLNLAWSSEDTKVEAGQVVKVTLSLSVSPNITGIYNFNFDIVIEGGTYFLGDINRDGSVNIIDAAIVNAAYGSTPTDSRWNPNADLNKDGAIDYLDSQLLTQDYGKSL